MCRLFGLHADKRVVTATFWLLAAPDNLVEQSKSNPDGTGLGVFEANGKPVLDKQPMAAWQDSQFAVEARELTGTTFIAHVRYSSGAALEVRNTHPFLQDDRLFAHNGVVDALDVVDARLRELGVGDLVKGETDSERIFALITACIRRRDGRSADSRRHAPTRPAQATASCRRPSARSRTALRHRRSAARSAR